MEKTRVKIGEIYWWVDDTTCGINCAIDYGDGDGQALEMLQIGNYFHTKKEAEVMAEKIRAVLNGANVIEKWKINEISNTLHVALCTECGLTGFDTPKEVRRKMAENETYLVGMLKGCIKIIEELKNCEAT